MEVLINNAHEEGSGGGGYWASQITKAITEFASVDLMRPPSALRRENNPELSCKTSMFSPDKQYDYFLDINHFQSTTQANAKKNIKVVYFPNSMQTNKGFDELVTLSDYSAKYIKEYWYKDSKVIAPYSKNLTPSKKEEKSICVVGNMFYEADGHCKNQHVLLDCLRELGKGWKMYVIGNVVNEAYYKHLVQMSTDLEVSFFPGCTDEVKEAIIRKSKFFWHANGYGRIRPDQTEHFGIAPEEGLKAGCLTYVHASGGAQDFCTSWKDPQDLIELTKSEAPNPDKPNFSSHNKAVEFWKGVLA
tara:strand:- start:2637 stop:3545 length:909 start_codon:yes stop_codon:yes gene_type:complete